MGISPTKLAAFWGAVPLALRSDVYLLYYSFSRSKSLYKGIFGGLDCRNIKPEFGVRLFSIQPFFGWTFLPSLVAFIFAPPPKKKNIKSCMFDDVQFSGHQSMQQYLNYKLSISRLLRRDLFVLVRSKWLTPKNDLEWLFVEIRLKKQINPKRGSFLPNEMSWSRFQQKKQHGKKHPNA